MMKKYDCFSRYLAAKKTIDDRSLNRYVWETLCNTLPDRPLRVLEIGCGIGTMIERVVDWGLFSPEQRVEYLAIDSDETLLQVLRHRVGKRAWGEVVISAETINLHDFLQRDHSEKWDLIIAHAFLDLFHIPTLLPKLLDLLNPGGLYWFTVNFDGVTALEPAVDPELDATIEQLYHANMDNRVIDGKPSGDSRAGRHLITQLQSETTVLAAGSSDWVVMGSNPNGYPGDEAYFLHFIIDTMFNALHAEQSLDAGQFSNWRTTRHAQIDAGELIYIAHQLDVVGFL